MAEPPEGDYDGAMKWALSWVTLVMGSTSGLGCDHGSPAHVKTQAQPLATPGSEPSVSSAPSSPAPAPPAPSALASAPAAASALAPPAPEPAATPAPAASEAPATLGLQPVTPDPPASSARPQSPNGNVTVRAPTVSGAHVSDAALVLARMRAGFRSCYTRSLDDDPKGHGELRVVLRVRPDGGVQSVDGAPSGSLSAPLVNCVKARVRVGQFHVMGGGNATVTVLIRFGLD